MTFILLKDWSHLVPFITHKLLNLTSRQHQFFYLKKTTIAEWQATREDTKFFAKLTHSNRNFFSFLPLSL
jgi:hypothetical protein